VPSAYFAVMPIDIALATDAPTGTLELRQAQGLRDGNTFGAFLVVRSGGFAAALPFFFSRAALGDFTHALGTLADARVGEARLPAREGDDFLALGMGDGDTATVQGELREPENGQLLRFRFQTPIDGLTRLRDGAQRLLDAPHG
jgi:hypothetical protein